MELVVVVLVFALAVVLIAGGLFLSRRSARTELRRDRGVPELPRAAHPADADPSGRAVRSRPPGTPRWSRYRPRWRSPRSSSGSGRRLRDRLAKDTRRVRRRLRRHHRAGEGRRRDVGRARGGADPRRRRRADHQPRSSTAVPRPRRRRRSATPTASSSCSARSWSRCSRHRPGAAPRRTVAPSVWMFVGVNGVGKTTSIAKLAQRETDEGRRGRARRRRHVPRRCRRAARDVGRPHRHRDRPRPGGRRSWVGGVRRDERRLDARRRPRPRRHRRATAHEGQPDGGAEEAPPHRRAHRGRAQRGAARGRRVHRPERAHPGPPVRGGGGRHRASCSPSSTGPPRAGSCSPSSPSSGSP